jgi:hypothetical protein
MKIYVLPKYLINAEYVVCIYVSKLQFMDFKSELLAPCIVFHRSERLPALRYNAIPEPQTLCFQVDSFIILISQLTYNK